MDEEEYKKGHEDNSTSNSSNKEYDVDFNMDVDKDNFLKKSGQVSTPTDEDCQAKAIVMDLDSLKNMISTDFGKHFQDMLIRALMQSTGTAIGLVASTHTLVQGGSSGVQIVNKGECSTRNTWNEETFNRITTYKKKKPSMIKTSTGEETDSQDEFPIPSNERL